MTKFHGPPIKPCPISTSAYPFTFKTCPKPWTREFGLVSISFSFSWVMPFIIKHPIFFHCNSQCPVLGSFFSEQKDIRERRKREMYIYRAREEKHGQSCNYQFCYEEKILQQTGKQRRANVSGQPIGLAETVPKSSAVADCITIVYLLWGHTPSLLLVSSRGLGLLITTNCPPSFRHFGLVCLTFLPPFKSFPCPVLSSRFPFARALPACALGGSRERWHNQVSSGLIQQSQIGNDAGSFSCEARPLLKSADNLAELKRVSWRAGDTHTASQSHCFAFWPSYQSGSKVSEPESLPQSVGPG